MPRGTAPGLMSCRVGMTVRDSIYMHTQTLGRAPETTPVDPRYMKDQGKSTLLVVDDDPYVLEAIGTMLREVGNEVVTCDNPADALALVEQHSFDVVLTDIKMPQVTGISL